MTLLEAELTELVKKSLEREEALKREKEVAVRETGWAVWTTACLTTACVLGGMALGKYLNIKPLWDVRGYLNLSEAAELAFAALLFFIFSLYVFIKGLWIK